MTSVASPTIASWGRKPPLGSRITSVPEVRPVVRTITAARSRAPTRIEWCYPMAMMLRFSLLASHRGSRIRSDFHCHALLAAKTADMDRSSSPRSEPPSWMRLGELATWRHRASWIRPATKAIPALTTQSCANLPASPRKGAS